jgi:hypothetical protein
VQGLCARGKLDFAVCGADTVYPASQEKESVAAGLQLLYKGLNTMYVSELLYSEFYVMIIF